MSHHSEESIVNRISVSNLCWKEDASQTEIVKLLDKYGIKYIDLSDRKENYEEVLKSGKKIAGYQSVIDFGISLNLLSDRYSILNSIKSHTDDTKSYRKELAPVVIGAPKSRVIGKSHYSSGVEQIRYNLNFAQEELSSDLVLAIEPVSASFGTNFCNNLKETYEFVKESDKFGINLDIANILQNDAIDDHLLDEILESRKVIHSHVSSKDYSIIKYDELTSKVLKKLLKKTDLTIALEAFDLEIEELEECITNVIQMMQ